MASRDSFDGIAKPAVLWIDDEALPSNPDVRLLELEGFLVHCVATGVAGLASARTNNYQAILLDLRLPDIPGLAVIAALRAESVSTPILVLTGFGDSDSAYAASHLGANGFEYKPLFGDDLAVAVRRLLGQSSPHAIVPEETGSVLPAKVHAEYAAIAAVLEGLHRLAHTQRGRESVSRADTRRDVISALVHALASPSLPMPIFLACATTLKRTAAANPATDPRRDLVADAEQRILKTLRRPAPSDSRVIAALRMLESAAAQRKRLMAHEIAKTQNTDTSYLGGLIVTETGFGFTDWRTAYLVRPGLLALAETNEYVKQIASCLLGFNHHPQFDAEFHRFFGITPTAFRRHFRNRP